MTEQREDQDREPAETSDRQWMTCGVGGIGAASFLADVGHEVPTALMASLVTGTLGAPASALVLVEGISTPRWGQPHRPGDRPGEVNWPHMRRGNCRTSNHRHDPADDR